MYIQGIEIKQKIDVGIILEKSSWFSVIESIFSKSKRISYPNDQDEVLYINSKNIKVGFISGQGSSMAACMTERLRVYGAKTIIRIGTCGALSKKIKLWIPIITTACFSDEGTSCHYLPKGYPIISDFDLNNILIKNFKKNGSSYQKGITFTTDGRWRENPKLLKKLSEIGVVSIEMETAAILSVCQFRKIPATAINLPADLPADEKNKDDFKGIPNRKSYKQLLEKKLIEVIPVVIDSLEEFYIKECKQK